MSSILSVKTRSKLHIARPEFEYKRNLQGTKFFDEYNVSITCNVRVGLHAL